MFDFASADAIDVCTNDSVVYWRSNGTEVRRQRKSQKPLVSMSWPQSRRSEVTINGNRVHLALGCHQMLQLLLLADPRRSVPMQELVETMWPNPQTQPITATGIVRVYVRHLRKLGIAIEGRAGFGYRIPFENRGQPERREQEFRRAA